MSVHQHFIFKLLIVYNQIHKRFKFFIVRKFNINNIINQIYQLFECKQTPILQYHFIKAQPKNSELNDQLHCYNIWILRQIPSVPNLLLRTNIAKTTLH